MSTPPPPTPPNPATPELGLIDGRFGRPWSWEERHEVVGHLARAGYGFYHHGPKADPYLRRTWREPHPAEEIERLAGLAEHCRAHGLRFGVALTPMDAPQPFDADTRAALDAKLDSLAAIGLDDLAILFDDLRGDAPGLAEAQADIVSHIGARTGARLFFCPTYYSDDPVLDRVFGQRPADYLATLGQRLDPSVRIYWTGEEVCAREISPGHLDRVAEQLGRPVCLWDNYPVNDGSRMSRFLHLRAFTGRPASLAGHMSGHAINPAIQPRLSCIPALTLAMSYAQGEAYRYGAAFRAAATELFGAAMAERLEADLLALNDAGHERLSDTRRAALRARYVALGTPVAQEVVRWLDGEDLMTDAEVQTQ